MKYLLETTEIYRVDSEAAAQELITEAKQGKNYILKKYSTQYKEKKSKGEVIDTWFKVTLIKEFNNEQTPDNQVEITYAEGSAF